MIPVLLGAFGLSVAGVWSSRDRYGTASPDEGEYGAVTLWQGGRGPQAGSGVTSGLGGRSPYDPYSYELPSSVVANWTEGTIYGFKIFGIPIGPQSRIEHLTKKIDKAKDKIAEYEKQAMLAVEDPVKFDRFSTQIATMEARIDKWEDKRDKVEMKVGAMYGAEAALVPEHALMAVEQLSNRVIDAARKLRRRPTSRKAYKWLLDMVASYDSLAGVINMSLRPALLQYQRGVGTPSIPSVGPPPTGAIVTGTQVFGILGSKRRRERQEWEAHRARAMDDPQLQAAAQRAHAAAEAYRQTRAEQPDAVQEAEEEVIDWRAAVGRQAGKRLQQTVGREVQAELQAVSLFGFALDDE